MGVKTPMQQENVIKVFFPPVKDSAELEDVERLYIRTLNPLFNQIRYEKGCQSNNMSELPNKVLSKKELAALLFNEMSESDLLVDPSNCILRRQKEWRRNAAIMKGRIGMS